MVRREKAKGTSLTPFPSCFKTITVVVYPREKANTSLWNNDVALGDLNPISHVGILRPSLCIVVPGQGGFLY